MTHDEIIAVVQAHKDGKRIEMRSFATDAKWVDSTERPTFNFGLFNYRVNPAPREWWLRSHNGEPCSSCGFHTSVASAARPASDGMKTHSIIHVREILE
jgi:hypothetical protein